MSANEIADYFLWLCARETPEDPDYLTPLKLQKLLYYAQGWSLAEHDAPLFFEDVEAWREGPVVRRVFERFRDLGRRPIESVPATEPQLPERDARTVRAVWDFYKRYSAFELSRRTHDESPWREAWGDRGTNDQGRTPIRHDTMRNEFTGQLESAQRRLLDRRSAIVEGARRNAQSMVGRRAL